MNTCQWGYNEGTDEPCDNICEGSTDYCPRHNRIMRKAEETAKKDAEKLALKIFKSKNQEPRKKPKPVSDKRKEQNKDYGLVRLNYLANHMECEAKIETVCDGAAIEIHHKGGRSGEMLTNQEYFLAVCRGCHDYIHQHPLDALRRNLSISRLSKKETI
jgi:hypothetical protein